MGRGRFLRTLAFALQLQLTRGKFCSCAGFVSEGMVLCAKTSETTEFVDVPASARPGDRVVLEGAAMAEPMTPAQVGFGLVVRRE